MNLEILKTGEYNSEYNSITLENVRFFFKGGDCYVETPTLTAKQLYQVMPNKSDQDEFHAIWSEIVSEYHNNIVNEHRAVLEKLFGE